VATATTNRKTSDSVVGRLFSIAFANLIAVYAAIFSLFVEEVEAAPRFA
jgi:hypothetical protein